MFKFKKFTAAVGATFALIGGAAAVGAPVASAEAPCVSSGNPDCTTAQPIGKKEGTCYKDAAFAIPGGPLGMLAACAKGALG